MNSTGKTVAPHWIMRLFGAESATFSLVKNGLSVRTKSGDHYVVLTESLAGSVDCIDGIFFSKLILKTNKGAKKFSSLPKKDASLLYAWLRQYWIKQLTPIVVETAKQIKVILSRGYLRSSRLKIIQELARSAVAKFLVVPDDSWAPGTDLKQFKFVFDVSRWDVSYVEKWRNQYVEHMKETFSDYFNGVESNPLTASQCEACIVDEDHNLVLAGAGTGKTSTMIGRAGFLLKSKQAKPNQILLLAFANKAAKEMQDRLELRLSSKGVIASTFHKLGKEIIASVEGTQPSVSPLAEDDKLLAWHVNQWFEARLEDKAYQKLALEYFQHHLYPEANPFDFETEGAYFEYVLANDIRTLKGELVKSLGECLVANYLFKRGIEYEYEAAYEHSTRDLNFRQYQPDFYLPESGIYLEYFGIDRKGNTAPYIDREQYHAGIEWKRDLHKQNQTILLEAYHYQLIEGSLFKELDRLLQQAEVVSCPLPPETVLATLREFGAISSFATLLAELLKRYRANCYEEERLRATIDAATNSAQVSAAIELLMPIIEDYLELLSEQGHIDFDDMIGKAIGYVRSGRYKSPWTFILVDEFQDISEPRARLVQLLKASIPECSLFCVGDDWQSIYRFTGSDISFTTGFNQVFGATKTKVLDLTFRFNNSIGDIASRFVLENPEQVRKQLKTHISVNKPAVSLLRADNRQQFHREKIDSRIVMVLRRIADIADHGSHVYLLGRYGFNLPTKPHLRELNALVPTLSLEAYTVHSSKGKEADYVVMLGLEKGKHGFPSQKVTHPLLDALLPKQEDYAFAEERRLFYVAITRARKRAYLISDIAKASEFVIELLDNQYSIELDEFEVSLAQKLFQLIHCAKCKTGSLVAKDGAFGKFFGCNNYPLCNHTENGCISCGSVMQRLGRFKVCINPDCDSWIPTCPECGGEMMQRDGRYGKFWGCKNFRRDDDVTCKHTEKEIEFASSLVESIQEEP